MEATDIEIGTQLHFTAEGLNTRFISCFVGMERNKFIIITPPQNYDEIKDKLDSEIVIKYLFEGSVYAFKSRIIEIADQKIKLFILEYPKSIQTHEVRSVKRKACMLPATFQVNEKQEDGVLKDITEKGCSLFFPYTKEAESLFNVDDQIVLHCQFPGVGEKIEILGTIKNARLQKKHKILGIAFDEIKDDNKDIIKQYLLYMEKFD